ncbi:CENP-S associating centromere protein X-domain-containing protein [Boeremia exigua]|uniref:CENP-S associating centromere protein X-domain-containing protein n=1 Tax=Boeremia exigua TaxID=749465 RepID=UPI001E8CA956|nr:CENP-S associating centromere protein X-domain-containing protein [Boeremia exigua]KAH6644735.1 CENP-S associating centromere protein X-domain-containing protein [Boeremia exigua]
MPPKNASANGSTRKGPQFKPPRPVKSGTKASTATASRATGASKKPGATTTKAGFQPAATVISSDEEDAQEEEDEFDALSDDLMEDVPAPVPARTVEPLTTAHPIPAPLLARLLHENFEDPNTQIQKGAMTLTGRYMEIFVREALARAKHERARSARKDGFSDGFLQVEDLEKLAPQLVLDF